MLLAVLTSMVFDMGLDAATRELQPKLLATACRKQTVHIQTGEPIQKDER